MRTYVLTNLYGFVTVMVGDDSITMRMKYDTGGSFERVVYFPHTNPLDAWSVWNEKERTKGSPPDK